MLADLRRQVAEQQAAEQHGDAARWAGEPGRRLPGAALRRQVQIRDRHCRFPTCRSPAHGTDTDHSVDHARGGATAEANLGEFCRHDHRLKHQGRWRLTQPEPGHFIWTSRLGRIYPVRPPPIIEPLPDPVPRNESEQPFCVRNWSGRGGHPGLSLGEHDEGVEESLAVFGGGG